MRLLYKNNYTKTATSAIIATNEKKKHFFASYSYISSSFFYHSRLK
ncbi:hypothetical protein CMALT394_40045 [Carnobacterium maltaromaticum]|nr:hypothetical protein CMALT394_40045 [Carnobacterium maltaromaticum]